MPSRPVPKTCQHCQQPYLARDERKNRPSLYCSRPCRDQAAVTQVTLTCQECQQSFDRKAYMADWSQQRGPFCSFACYGRWQSRHTTGPNNPFHDPDCHQILCCDYCGVTFHRPKWIRGGDLHFCSRGCFHDFATVAYKQLLPKGYGKSWRSVRKRILRRDHHECVECGDEEKLCVHHIQPYKTFVRATDAHAEDNLETLCRACHRRRHNQLAGVSR